MHAAIAVPGNARTILIHLFGRGLEDDRHVVERFQAMADGDIRRWPGTAPAVQGLFERVERQVRAKRIRPENPGRFRVSGRSNR